MNKKILLLIALFLVDFTLYHLEASNKAEIDGSFLEQFNPPPKINSARKNRSTTFYTLDYDPSKGDFIISDGIDRVSYLESVVCPKSVFAEDFNGVIEFYGFEFEFGEQFNPKKPMLQVTFSIEPGEGG